jgi:ribosomal protein L37AE/L43A
MNLPHRASDSGPKESPFFTNDAMLCESCGKPTDERTAEADLLVCDDCFEESIALQYAEKTCQTLHDSIIRSTSIQEVRKAMQEHKASCSVCGLRVVARGPVNSLAAPVKPTTEAA